MKKLFYFMALALLLLASVKAYAVPARSVVREYTQPDGTTVSLRLVGDEFSHFFLTDDDEIVVSQKGVFYFAQPGVNGYPTASKVLASNPANRTAAARALLTPTAKQTMLKASAAKRSALLSNAPYNIRKSAPAKVAAANWPSGIGLYPGNSFPVTGSPDVLIILVQFPDQAFSLPNAKKYFTDFASKEGFNDTGLVGGTNSSYAAHGSALDYFKASSNGKFTPNFHVLGPVTLSQKMAYYGGNDYSGNDLRPREMVEEAVQLLDSTTDFSVFDNDGDGYVDNIYVIYSGLGEANGGTSDTIWPHSWAISSSQKYDGKRINSYACSAEIFAKNGSLILADGIGTFCHEFSHVMGLPDLYQTEYDNSVVKLTPDDYSLMDHGSYNNNSRTPPTYSVYERNAMGWCDIEVLNEGEGKNGSLEHMLTSNKGYAIRAGSDNEFFLLENRQLSDWDAYLPGHGMLIWHINYNSTTWNNNSVNNSTQQYVDIVEAGGSADNTSATIMKQYPFPGTKGVTSFTSSTTPALQTWSKKAINVPLTNIKENTDGTVTFDICGGAAKLEAPVCNYTSSPVVSSDPVTVTLSKPASAPATAQINYLWMYDDASDMQEGVYSSPLTFTQSVELEYWLENGSDKSETKSLKIYIGEKPAIPTEHTIVFKDSNSDDGNDLTANTYANLVQEGSEIAKFKSCSKVFQGKTGLKFSSGSAYGSLTLTLNSDYQLGYKQVIVKAKGYGTDAAALSVNGSDSQSLNSELADYSFKLDGSVVTSITLTATKRLYVKSITFVAETSSDDPVVTETVATPTFSVEAGEVEKGTLVEINCDTEGASVHYTLDGTAPTAESTLYTEALAINEDVTVKAIAVKEGWNDSDVASATYTIKEEQGDDPEPGNEVSYTIVFKDSNSDNSTNLTAATYGNYVESGSEIATLASSSFVYDGIYGLKFSSSKKPGVLELNLAADFQLKYTKIIVNAVAWYSSQTGKFDDANLSVNELKAQPLGETLADYTFELDGNVLTSITLTATNRLYVKSITFVAETSGDDPVVTETVATPTFSVEAGEVEQGTVVEIICATEGATIHFTVDGTEPTTESDVYTDAIVIENSMTLKALAVKEGMNDSEVATVNYTVKGAGGDDPIFDGKTVIFDFNSDNGYGMELLSGNDQGFNDDGHTCVEGPITLTLHGKTRWWNNAKDGNQLRLFNGAYITVACPANHDIQSVHLNVGKESDWDNTSHISKVTSVDFKTNHEKGNTILHKVEVNYITTTSIVDVDADASEAVYYNLQGMRVVNPEHGVYIRVQDNKATKVVK